MVFYKRKLFVPALFLALFAASFKFGPDGVLWFWAEQPTAGIVLAVTSAMMWALMLFSGRKRREP